MSRSCSGNSIRVRFAAVIWLIFPSVLHSCPLVVPLSAPHHCLHLSPSSLSFRPNSFPWLCLAAHTEPDCSMFPELIGVTLAWQETQCHYGNAQSITGQRINTLSVIFYSHICVGLMVAMPGCYLLRGISSASPGGTLQYGRGQSCHCWMVGLPWMRAFPQQMKHLSVNFACNLSVERDNGLLFLYLHHLQDI